MSGSHEQYLVVCIIRIINDLDLCIGLVAYTAVIKADVIVGVLCVQSAVVTRNLGHLVGEVEIGVPALKEHLAVGT